MHALTPKTHQEAVAVFRHGVIGALTQAQMDRGQLSAALRQLAKQRFRPPGAKTTRSYSTSTLERWYYRFRARGLDGLAPPLLPVSADDHRRRAGQPIDE